MPASASPSPCTRAPCTLPILAFGTDEQRERFVPPLARGETIGAFALTEPEAGSDAGSLRTRADADGDGWTITGAKQWITNGSYAGTFLIFARTEPEIDGRARRLRVPARRRPRAGDARGGEARAQLVLDRRSRDRGRSGRPRPAPARGGARLRDRDVDARRRPDRDRRAGARDRAGRLRRRPRVREGAAAVRQADRRASRRSSSSSRTCRRRSTRRACSSTGPRG